MTTPHQSPRRLSRREERALDRQHERRERKVMLEQRLVEYLHFSQHDLDTYANDRLPQDHPLEDRLASMPVFLRRFRWLLLSVLLLLVVWPSVPSDVTDTVAAVLLAGIVIFMLEAGRHGRLQPPPPVDEVDSVEGIVVLGPDTEYSDSSLDLALHGYSWTPRQLDLSIGRMKFRVPEPTYRAFEDGEPYRIYYTTKDHTIIAAEVLLPD